MSNRKTDLRRLCAALVLLMFLMLGCDAAGWDSFWNGDTGYELQQQENQKAAEQQAPTADSSEKASGGDVMLYEDDGSDPLVGDWSYPGMIYTPTKKQWGKGKLYPDTEPFTVTFLKQGDVYSLKGNTDSKVTFDGTNVTIEGGAAGGVQSKYSGVLKGDTITGTRHHVGGELVYDGPWIATRVK